MYIVAFLVVGVFIFSAGTMALMVQDEMKELGPPPKQEKEPHLMVEDVFFMQSYVTRSRAVNEWMDIVTTVYMTNDGLADAENVKIVAFPIDKDKNLALGKVDTSIGKIPTQETSEIEFVITVPSGSRHNVNLLVFERNRLILRGSGSVVLQGTYTNTQRYQTEEIRGTVNDTDYDGMPDKWERYYGLDPTNGNDAKKDSDGDGMSNLAEYLAGTEPREPLFKNGEENGIDTGSAVTAVGAVVFIIIFIIIIVVAVAFQKKNIASNKERSQIDQKSGWLGQQNYSNNYTLPHWQRPLARCIKCGGWVVNDTCTSCATKYPNHASTEHGYDQAGETQKGSGTQTKIAIDS